MRELKKFIISYRHELAALIDDTFKKNPTLYDAYFKNKSDEEFQTLLEFILTLKKQKETLPTYNDNTYLKKHNKQTIEETNKQLLEHNELIKFLELEKNKKLIGAMNEFYVINKLLTCFEKNSETFNQKEFDKIISQNKNVLSNHFLQIEKYIFQLDNKDPFIALLKQVSALPDVSSLKDKFGNDISGRLGELGNFLNENDSYKKSDKEFYKDVHAFLKQNNIKLSTTNYNQLKSYLTLLKNTDFLYQLDALFATINHHWMTIFGDKHPLPQDELTPLLIDLLQNKVDRSHLVRLETLCNILGPSINTGAGPLTTFTQSINGIVNPEIIVEEQQMPEVKIDGKAEEDDEEEKKKKEFEKKKLAVIVSIHKPDFPKNVRMFAQLKPIEELCSYQGEALTALIKEEVHNINSANARQLSRFMITTVDEETSQTFKRVDFEAFINSYRYGDQKVHQAAKNHPKLKAAIEQYQVIAKLSSSLAVTEAGPGATLRDLKEIFHRHEPFLKNAEGTLAKSFYRSFISLTGLSKEPKKSAAIYERSLSSQHYITALREGNFYEFLKISQFIIEKYKHCKDPLGRDELVDLLRHELSKTDINADDLKTIYLFSQMCSNCNFKMGAALEDSLTNVLVHAPFVVTFKKFHPDGYLGSFNIKDKASYKNFVYHYNHLVDSIEGNDQDAENPFFKLYNKIKNASEVHPKTIKASVNTNAVSDNNQATLEIEKFTQNHAAHTAESLFSVFLKNNPIQTVTNQIEHLFAYSQEVKNAYYSFLNRHASQIDQWQFKLGCSQVYDTAIQLEKKLTVQLPKNYGEYLERLTFKNPTQEDITHISSEKKLYINNKKKYDDMYEQEIKPELIKQIPQLAMSKAKTEHQAAITQHKTRMANQFIHAIQNLIENTQWNISIGGYPIQVQQGANSVKTIKVPYNVAAIYALCKDSTRDAIDRYHEIKKIGLQSDKAPSLFKRKVSTEFYQTFKTVEQDKIKLSMR